MENYNLSLDISSGLSVIYLWLVFSITLRLFNCKIIKLIINNIYYQYITLLLSVFFLFIILEPKNSKKHIIFIFLNSLILLILFILLLKTNKYISMLILFLILGSQTIKVHINYLNNIQKKENIEIYYKSRYILNILIYILIILGLLFIFIEKGNKLKWKMFLSNNTC